MACLCVNLCDSKLLYRINYKVNALFLTIITKFFQICLPAVAPFQSRHNNQLRLIIHKGCKILGRKTVILCFTNADIDVLVFPHNTPGQSHLDKFQIGCDNVVTIL